MKIKNIVYSRIEYKKMYKRKSVEKCIVDGDLETLKFIIENNCEFGVYGEMDTKSLYSRIVFFAMEMGKKDILFHILESKRNYFSEHDIMHHAGLLSDKETILLIEKKFPDYNRKTAATGAAMKGDLELLKFLAPTLEDRDWEEVLVDAIEGRSKECVSYAMEMYLKENSVENLCPSIYESATSNVHSSEENFEYLKYLVEELGICLNGMLEYAVSYENLRDIKYLVEKGLVDQEVVSNSTEHALYARDVEIFNYLLDLTEDKKDLADTISLYVIDESYILPDYLDEMTMFVVKHLDNQERLEEYFASLEARGHKVIADKYKEQV